MSAPAAPSAHQLQLLQGASALFAALIADMDAAQNRVQIETYLFDLHGDAAAVTQALVRTAQRGVQVQVLVDGVGTDEVPQTTLDELRQAGVRWRVFSPLHARWGKLAMLSGTKWRRLHRKLIVIDSRVAYCGGINILDDHYDPNHGQLDAPRFDFSVRLQGPVVTAIEAATSVLWQRLQAVQSAKARDFSSAWHTWRKKPPHDSPALAAAPGPSASTAVTDTTGLHADRVELLLRDNLRYRTRIEHAYRRAIGAAQREIIIANAYFLPGRKLRKALITAARRGVRVRLLLQGKHEYFIQYHGTRPLYRSLLAAGVEIHEYAASFLHAKVAVIDADTPRAWSTVGSSNLDPLSLLLAREANVGIYGSAFAQALRKPLEAAMAECQRIDPQQYLNRPWPKRFMEHLAYGLMRLAVLLSGKRY
ncbi:MAG: cardiolipin synthase ClsB [Burkholderiales bacterium]